jgi:site-specific DNA recombinase
VGWCRSASIFDQNQESQVVLPNRRPSHDHLQTAENAKTPADHRERTRSRIGRVTLEKSAIRIAISHDNDREAEAEILTVAWAAPSPYRRREIIQGMSAGSFSARPMPTSARLAIIKTLRKAHRWLDELLTDPKQTIESIAVRESKSERSIRMTLSLAFLSPDLVKAAIDGHLPRGFGLTRLIDLPMAWSDQWASLGLKAPGRAQSFT